MGERDNYGNLGGKGVARANGCAGLVPPAPLLVVVGGSALGVLLGGAAFKGAVLPDEDACELIAKRAG